MGSSWLGGVIVALVFLLFLYAPGPGRRVEFTLWVCGVPLVRRPMPAMEVTAVGTPSSPRGLAKIKFWDPDVQVVRTRLRVPDPLQSP